MLSVVMLIDYLYSFIMLSVVRESAVMAFWKGRETKEYESGGYVVEVVTVFKRIFLLELYETDHCAAQPWYCSLFGAVTLSITTSGKKHKW